MALMLTTLVAPALLLRTGPSRTAGRLIASASSTAVFASPGWAVLQTELDMLPVFGCANEAGEVLSYEEKDGTSTTAIYYADIDAATEALETARRKTFAPLDIIPVGLGKAYLQSSQGVAVIVPGVAELKAAGAPDGTVPAGQQLPLFACMEMCQEVDGKPVLPLFMSSADARQAVAEAVEADAPETQLEVVSLSLAKAVELLVNVSDGDDSAPGPAFRFVPPAASLEYISNYLAS